MKTQLLLFIFFSFLIILFSCNKKADTGTQNNPPVTYPTEVVPYKLTWSDEFNTDGLPDTTKWGYDVGRNG